LLTAPPPERDSNHAVSRQVHQRISIDSFASSCPLPSSRCGQPPVAPRERIQELRKIHAEGRLFRGRGEVSRRIEQLLAASESAFMASPEVLQQIRAIEALEQLGTQRPGGCCKLWPKGRPAPDWAAKRNHPWTGWSGEPDRDLGVGSVPGRKTLAAGAPASRLTQEQGERGGLPSRPISVRPSGHSSDGYWYGVAFGGGVWKAGVKFTTNK
jgi:hypothetical protein